MITTDNIHTCRLTSISWVRLPNSKYRLRLTISAERTLNVSPTAIPTPRYRLTFKTNHASEFLETHGDTDGTYGNGEGSMPQLVFAMLQAGDDADAVRSLIGDLQQMDRDEANLPIETMRILREVWQNLEAWEATPHA
jgi:hypothetical protein